MSSLDQIVKGAPPPATEIPIQGTTPIADPTASNTGITDPLAYTPSSPPQIYLNLLILETSLRAQWLQLRTRRRQHTFFLTLLGLWILYFGYALFLAPREDGSGVGGSVYWMVEVTYKVCLMGGIVTGILVWGTGQWERGMRWPRRWIWTTNRGLRGFNCKLVLIKRSWWREMLSTLSFFFPYGLFSNDTTGTYRFVDQSLLEDTEANARGATRQNLPNIYENGAGKGCEEDLSPGGDCVKLLLLPKPFSYTFRENWDVFRTEYWEKENERRALLRKKIREQDRRLAKQEGGWFWWTGYRGWKPRKPTDTEKVHHHVHRHSSVDKDAKRTRSSTVTGSHSRKSSRSTNANTSTDVEDGHAPGHARGASLSAIDRRKKKGAGNRVQKLTPSGSRSASPEFPSPLARENSFTSVSSLDSERSGTPAGDEDSVRSLRSARSGGSSIRSTRTGK